MLKNHVIPMVNVVLALFLIFICDRGGIQTPNPQSRNLIFYSVELRGHYSRENGNFIKQYLKFSFILSIQFPQKRFILGGLFHYTTRLIIPK